MKVVFPNPWRVLMVLAAGIVALGASVTRGGSAPASEAAGGARPAVHDAMLAPARAGDAAGVRFTPDRAGFALTVAGQPIPYRVMAVTALPGESVDLVVSGSRAENYELRFARGSARVRTVGHWVWTAPEKPGAYPLRVGAAGGSDAIELTVLVMHPRAHLNGGSLHGFQIGSYRSQPLRGDPAYRPPIGFVEVWPADRNLLVSPHFTLGQFLCKQPGTPSYVALSVPLVLKLEAVLQVVNGAGHSVPTFHIMSGFRTPAYNAAIGNRTVYSRHLWGDAADIYVDVDHDGQMDDLDGNGKVDLTDAKILSRFVESVERSQPTSVAAGGLGTYRATAAHGPFVHLDARGYRARW